MARVAVLLRAHPVTSFNQLADTISSKQQALAAAASAGQDPSELLEQLYWLVRMAAHALADSGVGEIPLPPEAVLLAVGDSSLTAPGAVARPEQQQASAATAAAGAAAVERLSRSLLELTAVCLQQAAAAVVSSRLMEGCCWAAGEPGMLYVAAGAKYRGRGYWQLMVAVTCTVMTSVWLCRSTSKLGCFYFATCMSRSLHRLQM